MMMMMMMMMMMIFFYIRQCRAKSGAYCPDRAISEPALHRSAAAVTRSSGKMSFGIFSFTPTRLVWFFF